MRNPDLCTEQTSAMGAGHKTHSCGRPADPPHNRHNCGVRPTVDDSQCGFTWIAAQPHPAPRMVPPPADGPCRVVATATPPTFPAGLYAIGDIVATLDHKFHICGRDDARHQGEHCCAGCGRSFLRSPSSWAEKCAACGRLRVMADLFEYHPDGAEDVTEFACSDADECRSVVRARQTPGLPDADEWGRQVFRDAEASTRKPHYPTAPATAAEHHERAGTQMGHWYAIRSPLDRLAYPAHDEPVQTGNWPGGPEDLYALLGTPAPSPVQPPMLQEGPATKAYLRGLRDGAARATGVAAAFPDDFPAPAEAILPRPYESLTKQMFALAVRVEKVERHLADLGAPSEGAVEASGSPGVYPSTKTPRSAVHDRPEGADDPHPCASSVDPDGSAAAELSSAFLPDEVNALVPVAQDALCDRYGHNADEGCAADTDRAQTVLSIAWGAGWRPPQDDAVTAWAMWAAESLHDYEDRCSGAFGECRTESCRKARELLWPAGYPS